MRALQRNQMNQEMKKNKNDSLVFFENDSFLKH